MSMTSDPRWRGSAGPSRYARKTARMTTDGREGLIAAMDLYSGKVVCSQKLDSPAGFSFVGERIFVNSMYGNRVMVLDGQLNVVDTMADPLMSDLHSMRPSPAGVLITSSGTDAILEITPEGRMKWLWLASEHGYRRTPRGETAAVRAAGDYRSDMLRFDTGDQTTHCNSALVADYRGRETVLATLFHQGEIIAIDRTSGRHETVFSGMNRPHSIRRFRDGWTVCDSHSGAVVLLDSDFCILDVVEANFKWAIDAVAADGDKLVLIADSNNSRIVVWDIDKRRIEHQLLYPSGWRIFQVEVPPGDWAESLGQRGEGEMAACQSEDATRISADPAQEPVP